MNIAEIILLSATIISAFFAYVLYNYAQKCKEMVDEYKEKIQRLRNANDDCNAYYFIQRIQHPTDDEFEFNGKIAVGRRSIINHVISESVVKVFADEDESYNLRCAQELLDKLNE